MTTLVIIGGRGAFQGEVSSEAGVNLVGIGPGDPEDLTCEAEGILKSSEKIFGAQRYLDLMGEISPAKKVAHSGPCPKRSFDRFMEAKEVAKAGKTASIITGGDPSVFGSGWRIMDLAKGCVPVHVFPGVSAFSSVAANAGAPLVNDFVLLSNPEDRSMLSLLAGAGFGVVVYNVKGHLIASLLQDVDPLRPVVLARDVARDGEVMMIMNAEDLLAANPSGFRFTLIVACSNSCIKEGRIITRRGYEAKYSY